MPERYTVAVGVKNCRYFSIAESGELELRVERYVHMSSRDCEFLDAIIEVMEEKLRPSNASA